LLMLEYSQRLRVRQRNVLASHGHNFVATAMTLEAVAGGAQASGRSVAGLAVGQQADLVVLDANHPLLQGLPSPDVMLSAHVFASHRNSAIAAVRVGGRPVVRDGRHPLRQEAGHALAAARSALAGLPANSH
jgi:formimidoylglutamate deiminase